MEGPAPARGNNFHPHQSSERTKFRTTNAPDLQPPAELTVRNVVLFPLSNATRRRSRAARVPLTTTRLRTLAAHVPAAQSRPSLARLWFAGWPNIRLESDQMWSKGGPSGTEPGPQLLGVGEYQVKMCRHAESGPSLVDSGTMLVAPKQILAETELGPNLVKAGQIWSKRGQIWSRPSPDQWIPGQICSVSGQVSIRAKVGRSRAESGRIRPNVGGFRPTWDPIANNCERKSVASLNIRNTTHNHGCFDVCPRISHCHQEAIAKGSA